MRLFIAEKPSVANAIAKGLGGGKKGDGKIECGDDVVTWCFGHMLEAAKPDIYLPDDVPKTAKGNKVWRVEDLPIIPSQWKLAPKKEAAKQLKIIANLMKSAKSIVGAGDFDREGQNLIDEIIDFYNFRGPVLRYWASSMDEVTVKKALNNLRPNDEFRPMGEAAFARSCADWLIGMNLTRAYTLANRSNGGSSLLTVGRVQTPTLRLVVERDRAIANFKPKPFYKVFADINTTTSAGEPYRAVWVPSNAQTGLDEEGRLVDEDVARSLLASDVSGVVVDRSVSPKAQRPPTCYSLADIQFSANKLYGFDAEKTLNICQTLYERYKMTTYPRSDTGYLPESQLQEAPTVMASIVSAAPAYANLVRGADLTIKSKTWDDSKVSAHHGIIPTLSADADIADLSQDEQSIYDLVVRRYIAQFYPPFRYEQTIILHDINGQRFKASGKTIIDNGWKNVIEFEANALQKKSEDEGTVLPTVESGETITGNIDYKAAKTTPPSLFTEGALIRAMEQMHKHIDDPAMRKLLKESDGIGTSATRANIISELKKRNFLSVQKKSIVSTDLGKGLIDALPDQVTNPILTARAEEKLKQIEKGTLNKFAFIKEQESFVSERVGSVSSEQVVIAGDTEKNKQATQEYTCPNCNTRTLLGPKKKKKGSGYFWMCQGVFDEKDQCKSFFEDSRGKPILKQVKKRSAGNKRA